MEKTLLKNHILENSQCTTMLKARDPEFNNFDIETDKYLPIPQRELDINPNLRQNF